MIGIVANGRSAAVADARQYNQVNWLAHGFRSLASGRSGLFVYTQFVWNAVFILCLYLLLDQFKLLAVGIGFCVAYLIGAMNVWLVLRKLIGIRVDKFNALVAAFLLSLGCAIIYLSGISFALSAIFGSVATVGVAVFSIWKLDKLLDISDWVRQKLS